MAGALNGHLAGQVAVVTGAGTGIGRAIAELFAQEGARTVVNGRRPGPLDEVVAAITAAGGEAVACAADVSRPEDAARLIDTTIQRWGRIDILVNNAGLQFPRRLYANITTDDWDQVIGVILTGSFLCTKAALVHMRARRSGTIINIVSGSGKRAGLIGGVAYGAAKFGQSSLAQSVNAEERRHGIRACAIFPGEVDTPILEQRPAVPPPAARALMLRPEDVAACALLAAGLPARATVEEIVVRPTAVRDTSAEVPPPLASRA